ncbi:MAG: phosphatidylglycerol lysyltransferase [Treponema sp.]|nr:phosphatidylglycerol lysyltransferase [Treponema sp.]
MNRVWIEKLDRALEGLILSVSGWRGIFAACGDGESREPGISPAHTLIAAAAGRAFAEYLGANSQVSTVHPPVPPLPAPLVLVGTDTRPTGPAIADAVIRSLPGSGCRVRYAGLVAAPEIMAWARSAAGAAGFIYISASHNPIGHNGIKFGRTDGGVLPGPEAESLVRLFKALITGGDSPEDRANRLEALLAALNVDVGEIYAQVPGAKQEAYRAYFDFTARVVYGDRESELRAAMRRGLEKYPVKLVCDFNGSARTRSIDREFLGSLGLELKGINEGPGEIAHRIVPEGESLEPCRLFLEQCSQEDPHFLLGYLPDCDGDRGNLVIRDGERARSLEAQEVFALCCVAELSHLVWTGELKNNKRGTAIVVNDPTSMRVDRIAQSFGVEVFRAEVGEANVVGLARKLREQGYTVRVLGEGSAGGNITHPSAVRDPLDTLFSLLKLLAVREGPGFFPIWLERRGGECPEHFGLSDIIASLPPFVTTGTYEPEALLNVKTADHGKLKDRYQAVFLREWESRREDLYSKHGIVAWEAAAYRGMEERRGISRFADAGRGGLKIHFLNGAGLPVAAMWMRGSGTEPVFRVMADVEGQDRGFERDLIFWQRRMVAEADSMKN